MGRHIKGGVDIESIFRKVDPDWSHEELYEAEGWFLLIEVLRCIYTQDAQKKLEKIVAQWGRLQKIGQDAEQVIGMRYFGSHPWVSMATFGPWFQKSRSWLDEAVQDLKLQPMRFDPNAQPKH